MNKSLIVPKTNLTIELFDWFLACISYLEYWLNLSFKGPITLIFQHRILIPAHY